MILNLSHLQEKWRLSLCEGGETQTPYWNITINTVVVSYVRQSQSSMGRNIYHY